MSHSKATNLLQRYVLLRTDDAKGYAWLSRALSLVAQYDEAASAAKRAITLNPTNAYYYRQLGYCRNGSTAMRTPSGRSVRR